MKVLVCTKPGLFEYGEVKDPELRNDFSIIKIKRVGVCGTDLHAFEGTQPFFTYPRILGHELSGELVEYNNAPGFKTGEQVTFIPYFNCGVCIACKAGKTNCCVQLKVCGVHIDGGMAEYLAVPSASLLHGNDLSIDELALIEPLSIGAHGIKRAEIKENEFVLIIGAGPIGLAAIEFANIAGVNVIALDVNEHRLAFCKSNMQTHSIINSSNENAEEALKEITNGEMPSVVIDATGNLKAINEAFKYLAHGGRYVLIGLQREHISFSHPEFHKREGTLMSSRNATRSDFEHVINSIQSKKINPLTFITHRVLFGQVKEEFPQFLNPANKVVKAMIEM